MIALASFLLVAGGALGAVLLRRSWTRRDGAHAPLLLAGWGVPAALLVPAFALVGPVKGLALTFGMLFRESIHALSRLTVGAGLVVDLSLMAGGCALLFVLCPKPTRIRM